jgi:hypothetical protein
MRFEKGIAQLFVVREERVATVVIIPTDVVIFELGHDFTVVLMDVQEFVKRVQREFPAANVPAHNGIGQKFRVFRVNRVDHESFEKGTDDLFRTGEFEVSLHGLLVIELDFFNFFKLVFLSVTRKKCGALFPIIATV